eukprot:Rmarinus@m.20196
MTRRPNWVSRLARSSTRLERFPLLRCLAPLPRRKGLTQRLWSRGGHHADRVARRCITHLLDPLLPLLHFSIRHLHPLVLPHRTHRTHHTHTLQRPSSTTALTCTAIPGQPLCSCQLLNTTRLLPNSRPLPEIPRTPPPLQQELLEPQCQGPKTTRTFCSCESIVQLLGTSSRTEY